MLINDPDADQNFKTIEVAGTKRLSQGWQLFVAYSATKINLPFTCNNSRGPNGGDPVRGESQRGNLRVQ